MSLEAMGLTPDADEAAVRARFRELAAERHPDKGGSADAFQQAIEWRDAALNEVAYGNTLATARSSLHKIREAARGTVCPRCDGTGSSMTAQSGFRTMRFACKLCGGKGKL